MHVFFKTKILSYLKQFILPVRGLGPGRKSFKYKIGKEFFEQFENSEIEQANILLHLEVNKQTKLGEIDPRGDKQLCYTIRARMRAIAGGVLEAILMQLNV